MLVHITLNYPSSRHNTKQYQNWFELGKEFNNKIKK